MDSPQLTQTSGHKFLERRIGEDRREKPSFPPRFSGQRRRKTSGRRKTDTPRYVDIYPPSAWTVATSILLLSFLDAVLTTLQVAGGRAKEFNPFMSAVLTHGGWHTFISVKLAMTAMPLAIIVLHREWTVARFAARICLWAYILLTCYHLYLILLMPR